MRSLVVLLRPPNFIVASLVSFSNMWLILLSRVKDTLEKSNAVKFESFLNIPCVLCTSLIFKLSMLTLFKEGILANI